MLRSISTILTAALTATVAGIAVLAAPAVAGTVDDALSAVLDAVENLYEAVA